MTENREEKRQLDAFFDGSFRFLQDLRIGERVAEFCLAETAGPGEEDSDD